MSIGLLPVPVKDSYRNDSDKKNISSRGSKQEENAANAGALWRVGKEIGDLSGNANNQNCDVRSNGVYGRRHHRSAYALFRRPVAQRHTRTSATVLHDWHNDFSCTLSAANSSAEGTVF